MKWWSCWAGGNEFLSNTSGPHRINLWIYIHRLYYCNVSCSILKINLHWQLSTQILSADMALLTAQPHINAVTNYKQVRTNRPRCCPPCWMLWWNKNLRRPALSCDALWSLSERKNWEPNSCQSRATPECLELPLQWLHLQCGKATLLQAFCAHSCQTLFSLDQNYYRNVDQMA